MTDGNFGASEIPRLLMSLLLIPLDRNPHHSWFLIFKLFLWMIELCGKHCHVGSLAGAAHLSSDNADVLR